MRSDRRGVIERNQAMAFPGGRADPGDNPKNGAEPEYRAQVFSQWRGGTALSQPQEPSKPDDYELTLTSRLFRESRRHRKQRKTVRRLHSDLVQLGYTG